MIIRNAQIQFAHAHELKEEYRQKETLFTQRPDNEDGSAGALATLKSREIEASRTERSLAVLRFQNERTAAGNDAFNPEQDLADLSRRGRPLAESLDRIRERLEGNPENERGNGFLDIFGEQLEGFSDEDAGLDAETYQLKSIVESFTGREIKLSRIAEDVDGNEQGPQQNNGGFTNVAIASPEQEAPTVTASLIYQYQESYLEEETSLFSASGLLTLESGETLDIDFSQFNQRSFYLENSLELELGEVELTDPLMVNLQGPLCLSNQKYQFDLDNDGEQESINFAKGNSGFLALDRNQNGVIDDGTELFGALTGNGFTELSKLDEDGNGFIDSGDGVFTDLLFYQKDANGQDYTQKISDLGIGALYLGHQATPFQVKNSENELQAVVRSSGIFVNENGSVGSMQQIDLVV